MANTDSRKEMRYCRQNFIDNEVPKVPMNIRAMKRLWVGKGLNGLLTRRDEEAALVELGLKLQR